MKSNWLVGAVVIVVALLLGWWAITPHDTALTEGDGMATTTTEQVNGNASQQVAVKNYSNQSVLAIAQSISGASTFGSWLTSTGVSAELSGAGQYTVFVPTDGSISQLPPGTYTNLSAAEKKRFVEYHIIKGKALDVDALTAGVETSLSGDALNVSYGQNKIPLINSAIVIEAYKGKNGIVYLVDNALIPPQKAQ